MGGPDHAFGLDKGPIYAREVRVETGNFSGNLSSLDDTVQKALDTLDNLVASGAAIGGNITGGTNTYVLYVNPSGKIAQSDTLRVVSDGIEFGSDPSFHDVVFGQDRVGGESGFTMRDDDATLAIYYLSANHYGYGGGSPDFPSIRVIDGETFLSGDLNVGQGNVVPHNIKLYDAPQSYVLFHFDDTVDFTGFTISTDHVIGFQDITMNPNEGSFIVTSIAGGNQFVCSQSGIQLNPVIGTGIAIILDAGDLTVTASSGSVSFNTVLNVPSIALVQTISSDDSDLTITATNSGALNLNSQGQSVNVNPGDGFNVNASAGSIAMTSGGQYTFNGGGTANWAFVGIPEIDLSNSDITDSLGSAGGANTLFTSLGGSSNGTKWQSAASLGLLTTIPWDAPGTIGSTTPNTGKFTTLATTGAITKVNNINTAGSQGVWAVRAASDQPAQTTGQTITTFTPGSTGSFIISGYLNITAVTLDVIKMTITYKDENGTSQTITPLSSLNIVGNNSFTTGEIRCSANIITVASSLTTGTGSITYDQGATITQLR